MSRPTEELFLFFVQGTGKDLTIHVPPCDKPTAQPSLFPKFSHSTTIAHVPKQTFSITSPDGKIILRFSSCEKYGREVGISWALLSNGLPIFFSRNGWVATFFRYATQLQLTWVNFYGHEFNRDSYLVLTCPSQGSEVYLYRNRGNNKLLNGHAGVTSIRPKRSLVPL